jgi:3-dehydroquinate synthase
MGKILPSLKSVVTFLKKQRPSSVYLVTSKPLTEKLRWAIRETGIKKRNVILIPDGERAKEWKELKKLLAKFRNLNVDRGSVIIALGGGTVGDLVGFAASIYLRGIRYIQIPTTFLAQVDSAHGGKTGIDFLGYKNQIGSTYNPIAVALDPRFLKSLKKKQIIDGLGETLKAGLIKDASILSLLANENTDTLMRSRQLPVIIKKAIRVKRWYVSRDPNEKNIRRVLNFGHTIGHAAELSQRITHGRAILVGMLEELRITEAMKYTDPAVRPRFIMLLRNLGIASDASLKLNKKVLRTDKKMSGRTLSLPVVEREGKSRIVQVSLATFCKYI